MLHEDTIGEEEEWLEEDDSGDDLLQCPACRQAVHEDTQQCPHCGDWITPVYPRSRWGGSVWLVAAILVIAALILMTIR